MGRPLFCVNEDERKQGHFYFLASPVKEPENVRKCCFLAGKWITQAGWIGDYISLEPPELLFNAVQQIFDELEEWEQKLQKIRENAGGVRELLQASAEIFQNPLVLMGQDFSLVAESGLDQFREGEALFYPGSERMELINALKQDEQYNAMLEREDVVWFPGHIVGFNSWNINLQEPNAVWYRLILMEYRKTLGESDAYLLKVLAYHVRMALHAGSAEHTGGENLRSVFRRVLTDRTADYMEISRKLIALGWGAEDEYLCLVYQTTYLDQRNLTAHAICSYMEEQIPHTSSFPFKEDIVCFFDLTLIGESAEDLGNRLKYFIRESFLKAGYSRVMTGHSNLRRQYIQATLALDVGGRKMPYLWIHWFDRIAFTYILEQSTRRLPGYMLCHEKLPRLKEIDAQQHTEYYRTLRVYLEENLNATQTARELYIHRSTLLYRLERIREILDSDLTDPDELLYLNFSFRLLEQEEQKDTGS